MWLKIIFIFLLYMTFSSKIINNNLFYKLYKNKKYKNSLEQIILNIVNTLDTNYDTIINIVKKNKSDSTIYNYLHHIYWSKYSKDTSDNNTDSSNENSYIITRAIKNANKIKSIIPKNINLYNRNVFVDIGCGDGSITSELAKIYSFKKSIGVDVENWFDTYINKNKNIELIITDGKTINIKDNSVDVILCNHVLHHIENLDDMLDEIARIIKKDGILIIKEHNCYYKELSYVIDIYHALYELVYRKTQNDKFIKNYYSNYLSDKELYAKLKKRNFEIINYVYDGGLLNNYYAVYKQTFASANASVTSGPNTK
jgi:ubiquinone/menaquinone biosynthesis C-methylase UbiE